MKKSKGRFLIILGLIMLVGAGGLIFYNVYQDKKSGETAHKVLVQLEKQISEVQNEIPQETTTEPVQKDDLYAEYEEPVEMEKPEHLIVIDDKTYVGIISIPKLGIELPVMSEWSYPNLKLSPCRYSGRADAQNMILAAHNYSSHFGNISDLTIGDELIFTAADGAVYRYRTIQIETLNGTDVERLMNSDKESWALTLFTCTLGGQSRVCVRAEQTE